MLRQGAQPRVAEGAAPDAPAEPVALAAEPVPRHDFRPSRPDVSSFPRRAWARCLRDAVASIPDADLIYGDPCGVESLRTALSDYLGRVRGVVAEPARIVVTSGYIQGLGLVCRALAASGVRAGGDRAAERARAGADRAARGPGARVRAGRRLGPGGGGARGHRRRRGGADPGAPAPDGRRAHARAARRARGLAARDTTRSRSRTTTTRSTATTGPPSGRCRASTRIASSTRARPPRPSRPP